MSRMTSTGAPSAARVSPADIDDVDVFARKLYRRARVAGTDFAEVTTVVRGLHTVLKHLKCEAEDPDSLLNSADNSVYVRQLSPIVEDCDFTLKQLDTLLEKYGGSTSDGESGNSLGARASLGARERDMVGLIRTKLSNQKLNIDMFLDTVQLHNPSKSHQVVDTNNANLDNIKDKVDAIAARICQRKNSIASDGDDEELWEQFRDELEKDGFSKDVLRNNQDVLRAYIRQLDEASDANNGIVPTVRGFLECYQPPALPPAESTSTAPAPSAPYPGAEDDFSPKEMYPSIDNEKFFPSMKMERLLPDKNPPRATSRFDQPLDAVNYDHFSDVDDMDDGASDSSTALVISTRDLMALDKREADLAIAMGNMHLHPRVPPYNTQDSFGTSPHQHHLPANSNAGLLTASPNLPPVEPYALAPQFDPSIPPPPYGSSPPPTLHSNSISAPVIPSADYPGTSHMHRHSRLAPDSQGRDIPLEAKWTRIRRSLVSPEVLNQAGVRYEARPDFVAVLGVFTKEEIAQFARRSEEVRRRRGAQNHRPNRDTRDRYHPDKYKNWDVEAKRNGHVSSSSDLYDTSDSEDEDELPSYRPRGGSYGPMNPGSFTDEKTEKYSEDDKGTKVYPFIVSPPEKDNGKGASPASTVKPKPILKNKNDDPHVRFDPEPHVLDGSSSRSAPRERRDRDRRHRDDRDRDRDRHIPRSYDDRDEESYRHHRSRRDGEDRRRDKERDDYSSSGRRRRRDDRDKDGDRRRDRYRREESDRRSDRDRDEDDRSEDRSAKKKSRGETLRAVGLGGAAASLLSVLTEAAVGF